jgi:hypothetical protein
MKITRFGWVAMVLALGALGCSGNDEPAPGESSDGLEIVGDYVDGFDMEHSISEDTWGAMSIVEYDNDENVVYAQQPDDDMFNPSKFTKTVYTEPEGGDFYFCMVVFDAETLADAKESDAEADDSEPAESGCGGMFPWTLAIKQ